MKVQERIRIALSMEPDRLHRCGAKIGCRCECWSTTLPPNTGYVSICATIVKDCTRGGDLKVLVDEAHWRNPPVVRGTSSGSGDGCGSRYGGDLHAQVWRQPDTRNSILLASDSMSTEICPADHQPGTQTTECIVSAVVRSLDGLPGEIWRCAGGNPLQKVSRWRSMNGMKSMRSADTMPMARSRSTAKASMIFDGGQKLSVTRKDRS